MQRVYVGFLQPSFAAQVWALVGHYGVAWDDAFWSGWVLARSWLPARRTRMQQFYDADSQKLQPGSVMEDDLTVAGLGRTELENLLSRLLEQTGASLSALVTEQKHSAAADDDSPPSPLVTELPTEDDTPPWLVDAARHLDELKETDSVQPGRGHTTQLSLAKPAPGCRLGLRLQHFEGVVIVLAVQPDSAAAAAGLRVGDRLLEVAGAEVTSGDQVAALLGDAAGAVTISVLRPEPPEPPREEEAEPSPASPTPPAAELAARAEQHKLEAWAHEQKATRVEEQEEQAKRTAQEEAALARARAVWQSLDASAREQLSALPFPAARALLWTCTPCRR